MSEIAGLRYRCPAYMSNKKIIFFCSLTVALSALIFLSAYFLKIKRFVNVPLNPSTVIATSTQGSIDTSNWRTFTDAELKMSFSCPQEWGQYKKRYGSVFEDAGGFYRFAEIRGDVFFEGGDVTLDVVSFHSTGSLVEVNMMSDTGAMFDSHVFGDRPEIVTISGLPGYRVQQEYLSQKDEANGYQIVDQLLLKHDEDYFFFTFGIKRGIQDEKAMLKSFNEWNEFLVKFQSL